MARRPAVDDAQRVWCQSLLQSVGHQEEAARRSQNTKARAARAIED